MARQWRIRHKLMLGVGLVAVIVSLLLGGTLRGLLAFRTTVKGIGSKLIELEAAERLKEDVARLAAPTPGAEFHREQARLLDRIRQLRGDLEHYEGRLKETLQRRRDLDRGHHEQMQIEGLREGLDRLEKLAGAPLLPQAGPGASGDDYLHTYRAGVEREIQAVARATEDLRHSITDELAHRIKNTESPYRLSMWTVGCTSVGGVLLMAVLARLFYGWMFYPLRDLKSGADRAAEGNFDHAIVVRSSDELADLAGAFNHMTSRLRDLYRDLARQVNERSRQLVRSERLASVGFLAAGVAHEINNPLASIAFCSEALESRLTGLLAREPEGGEVIGKYLRMIQDAAFRCKKITERLLEFSRGGDARREATDLGALVQAVLDVAQHLPNSRGKHVVFEPKHYVTAWINSPEVNQVVLNLVVNALDSMDEGGTLTIELSNQGGVAELRFTDTGCGMAPDVLENIFEPFFTRSRTGKGTGLGLTISHLIISQHRGEIEASSPGPGQGSTFVVRLPTRDVGAAEASPLRRAA